jgi:hypothetical protein
MQGPRLATARDAPFVNVGGKREKELAEAGNRSGRLDETGQYADPVASTGPPEGAHDVRVNKETDFAHRLS